MSGPLDGVRVIDVTTTLLGPYCSLRLAECGADVIKVEAPSGDVLRQPGPMGVFLTTNAGKRGVVLDLKDPAGHAALLELTRTADVFLHNMPAPTARRLRIDPVTVREVAPDIVYCAAYGYGEAGPYAGRPAYDDGIQAASGLTSTQHASVDRPAYVSSPVADKTTGLMAAFSIAAALVRRARTGDGVDIEVPMFEVMTSYVLQETLGDSVYLPPAGPPGSPAASRKRRPYTTADGYLSLMLITDEQWRRFLTIAGRADLAGDERYATVAGRSRHRDTVYGSLDAILATRTTGEWMESLLAERIPVAPVRTLREVLDDDHLAAVGFFQHTEHPTEGPIRRPRSGVTFSTGPVDLAPAPGLGEHTEEVLSEAGVDEEVIKGLTGG